MSDYLTFDGLSSQEDCVTVWQELDVKGQSLYWARGDLLNTIGAKWGDKAIENFAKEVKKAPSLLRKYRQTAKAFPVDKRFHHLTFWHHYEVRDQADPEGVLKMAEENGWTVRQIHSFVQGQKVKDVLQELQDKGGRLIDKVKDYFAHQPFDADQRETMLNVADMVKDAVDDFRAEQRRRMGAV